MGVCFECLGEEARRVRFRRISGTCYLTLDTNEKGIVPTRSKTGGRKEVIWRSRAFSVGIMLDEFKKTSGHPEVSSFISESIIRATPRDEVNRGTDLIRDRNKCSKIRPARSHLA